MKSARYLFNLTLPTIYFSYIAINYILKKIKTKTKINKSRIKNLTISISFILIIFSCIALIIESQKFHGTAEGFKQAIIEIDKLGLPNQTIATNFWVPITYLGRLAKPIPRSFEINNTLDNNIIILLFKNSESNKLLEDYKKEYGSNLPILIDKDEFVVIAKPNISNTKKEKYFYIYTKELQKSIKTGYNYEININPCFLLFKNHTFLEKTCNFVNLNGFKEDNNRAYG